MTMRLTDSDRQRLVCLTNIPTPYRLHLFRVMSGELADRGWDFEAWFMAHSEPGRYWSFNPDDFGFRHRILSGCTVVLKGIAIHTNPCVIGMLARRPADVLLVGGSLFQPTSILAATTALWIKRSATLFWTESHLKAVTHKNKVAVTAKRLLLAPYPAFVVPGEWAADYVRAYAPGRPIFTLPNGVDERLFGDTVQANRAQRDAIRMAWKIPGDRRMLLLPARLAPEKNIIPFVMALSQLDSAITQRFVLFIAGDGPLRNEVATLLESARHLQVRMLGHVSETDMLLLYTAADGFVLPSVRDRNPLSVIEALWAGLPLLLSDCVGNQHEALVPTENGWLFDPKSWEEIRLAVEKWCTADSSELEIRGQMSKRIAQERFDTKSVVRSFLDQVLPATKLTRGTDALS